MSVRCLTLEPTLSLAGSKNLGGVFKKVHRHLIACPLRSRFKSACPRSPAAGEGQGVVFMTNKDPFDLWRAWAKKPPHSTLTIPAEIHEAVMALPPNERHDRAKVNEAVRKSRGS